MNQRQNSYTTVKGLLESSTIIYLYMLFVGIYMYGCTEGKVSSPEWKLIWEDQFNIQGLPDTEKWGFAPRNSPDWAKYCTDSEKTTIVKEGKLHLRGIKNSSDEDTVAYQTGCISTKGKFSFKYGKVEVKAKLSKGKGSWPAIWMMPADVAYGGWPHSGEIDIMEHLNSDKKVYQTIHSTYVDIQGKREDPPHHTTVSVQPEQFNIYGVEWYPDRLEFFVNNKKTFTYPKNKGADSDQWPFDQPFYLILDQALGGNWVGQINDQDLPVAMEIDWVQVYQAK